MPKSALSRATVGFVRKAVLAFYANERRDFPWRLNRDPYRILVSEIMLQQTRAETVVPYFERWMERFPTMRDLADAETEEVLGHWQGLGYYRRARNLHGAVREVEARYGGALPQDPKELRALPGIGPYTAGAVASIAFGVPAPAVDGNVRRVLSRLMDEPDPSPGMLRSWAEALVDPADPGSFNQGLMEIGARVCVPRSPSCPKCPLAPRCRARKAGSQEERPARSPQRPISEVSEAVVVLLRDRGSRRSVLLRRRPREGLLGGMWELPGRAVPGEEASEATAREMALSLTEGTPELAGSVEPLDHAFSHMRVRYMPFVFTVSTSDAGCGDGGGDTLRWADRKAVEALPMSVAQRKILERVRAANLHSATL